MNALGRFSLVPLWTALVLGFWLLEQWAVRSQGSESRGRVVWVCFKFQEKIIEDFKGGLFEFVWNPKERSFLFEV